MRENDPALILVPGTLCDHRLFAPQIGALRDFATVQIADLSRDDSIAGMAERILSCAPPRFAIAGLSMGGMVALEVLHRAAGRVERLALLDTNPAADTPERSGARDRLLAKMRRRGIARVVMEELAPLYLASCNSAVSDVIGAMAADLGPEVYARQSRALAGRADHGGALQRIACPCLVLCGADDRICPPALHETMARSIPGGHCTVIAGAGHLPTLEQPETTTAALVRWLAGAADSPSLKLCDASDQ